MRPGLSHRSKRSSRRTPGGLFQARSLAIVALVPVLLGGSAAFAPTSTPSPAGVGIQEHKGANGEVDVNVCSDATPIGFAHCLARVRTDPGAAARTPAIKGDFRPAAGVGNGGAYDPAYLQSAYNAPSVTEGAGQTVAIVDAFDDPKAESDLATYRTRWGLPACTTANGCFRKVDQRGGTAYPSANTGWAQEISLDVDMVSAMCPNCKILLVVATNNSMTNLGIAVNEAVALGANVVSNSYGGGEYSSESSDSASYFNHPGVAIVASSGDNGYGVEFPASSRYVTAVGGTSLIQNTNTGTRDGSETAWSGAGSGCSAFEPKPTWQHDASCAKRTVADVSAVADPHTGVWVYDSYNSSGWLIFGGTSAAAPIVGSMYALTGGAVASVPASSLYASPGSLNDVVSGSNGNCGSSYLCTATAGYDGPTGLGTPNGIAAFSATPIPPSAPSAPQNLSAGAGDGRVTLSWSPPVSSGGSNVAYRLYRGTSAGGEILVSQADIATLTTTDTGLTNGVTYYYQVKAVNATGEGPGSNEATATPMPVVVPPQVPASPQSLVASTSSIKGVTLSWTAPASNGGSPITSYTIYRSRNAGRESSYASATCVATTCSYENKSAASGVTFYYQVAAVNLVGTGPRSNEASAQAR